VIRIKEGGQVDLNRGLGEQLRHVGVLDLFPVLEVAELPRKKKIKVFGERDLDATFLLIPRKAGKGSPKVGGEPVPNLLTITSLQVDRESIQNGLGLSSIVDVKKSRKFPTIRVIIDGQE